MVNYKEMYSILFNKMTDIIEEIQQIQRQTEEMYLNITLRHKTQEAEEIEESPITDHSSAGICTLRSWGERIIDLLREIR